MSLNIPAFLQAFNHLSPVKWSIGNLAPYTLAGVTFSCTEVQRLPNGQCPVTDGETEFIQSQWQCGFESSGIRYLCGRIPDASVSLI